MAEIGRNDPCPCGSGKKYKKCCLAKGGPPGRHRILPWVTLGLAILAGAGAYVVTRDLGSAAAVAGAGVVAAGGIAIFMNPPPPNDG